jgi:hypothetical protein
MQPTIHDAIRSAHPEAVTIYGNDVDTITAIDDTGNPVTISTDLVTAHHATLLDQHSAQQVATEAARASAIAKLTALGLTADEIKALTGN